LLPTVWEKGCTVVERADQLPGTAEDFVVLNFEDGGISVKARSRGVRAFDLFVDVEVEGFASHGRKFLTKKTQ
jgi:hypothetical protein